ncbi:hypothetical protein BDR26DRAFT_874448, partial [Obelidium mucronatum]
AADKGLCEAAWEAAMRLYEGKVVKQDLTLAARYFEQVASSASTDQGPFASKREAEQVLAQWYARGTGVEQDLEKSIEYYTRIHHSVITNRRKLFPSEPRLCLSNQRDHTPEHSIYISCSRDFDNDWAQLLQVGFATETALSAYMVDECGTGRYNSYSYPAQSVMEKLFDAEKCHSGKTIEKAHDGIVAIITPFALKLMQLRFAAGLSDPLFLEWEEIIRTVRKNPSRKLVLLKLPSHSESHSLINGFKSQKEQHPAIAKILSELEEISGSASITIDVPFDDGYQAMDRVVREITCNIAALHFETNTLDALELLARQHHEWHTTHRKSKELKIPHSLPTVFSWFPRILHYIDDEIAKIAPDGNAEAFGQDEDDSLDNEGFSLVSKKTDICFCYADLISKFPNDFAAASVGESTAVEASDQGPSEIARAAAQKYFEIGARLHDRPCQIRFAQCIESTDPSLALHYYENAASCEEVDAIFRLAELWETGSVVVGGKASMANALEYYKQGEELGHKESGKRALECLKRRNGLGRGGRGKDSGNGKRDVIALYRLEDDYVFPEVVKRIKAPARRGDEGDENDSANSNELDNEEDDNDS